MPVWTQPSVTSRSCAEKHSPRAAPAPERAACAVCAARKLHDCAVPHARRGVLYFAVRERRCVARCDLGARLSAGSAPTGRGQGPPLTARDWRGQQRAAGSSGSQRAAGSGRELQGAAGSSEGGRTAGDGRRTPEDGSAGGRCGQTLRSPPTMICVLVSPTTAGHLATSRERCRLRSPPHPPFTHSQPLAGEPRQTWPEDISVFCVVYAPFFQDFDFPITRQNDEQTL